MWARCLALFLVLGMFCAQLSASPQPSPPSSSVTLSSAEYDQIQAAMESAKASLEQSNRIIADQSKSLKRLWIFSGALAGALIIEAVADIVHALKE